MRNEVFGNADFRKTRGVFFVRKGLVWRRVFPFVSILLSVYFAGFGQVGGVLYFCRVREVFQKSLNDFPMLRSHFYEHVFYSCIPKHSPNASIAFASSPAVLPATMFFGERFENPIQGVPCVSVPEFFLLSAARD